ncbi:MAG: 1-acyl-sn-glycerol-3-phosphate acyltransferase [Anaerolineales bacterium]|nr:1-acyl-sn-glycerol-3-phosphate acyltransferase [Anaerolineales bacterium]MCX7609518.1 1-acyl-sn-glycerol-3-phosphate acyltransferase [Anaerolineales bacterium]MDW8226186.1 lysophospholipid acyltransferase family protein [Anaerolineales bacterium]
MNPRLYKIFRFILRTLLGLIARVEAVGFEKLPTSGGYVIAANHIGRLDAALPYILLDRPDIIMVVAEKYQKYAFYRWLVKITNGMFIDRYNADIVAIREVLRRLRAGGIFVITPEGTRSKSGNLQEAKPGAIYLAWKAGVPVLPAALTGCEDSVVLERLKRFQRLHIRVVAGDFFILPPEAKGADRDVLLRQYTDEVMCRIAALLPSERRGVYAEHPRLKELLNISRQETA